VLDGVCAAVWFGLLAEQEVMEVIKSKLSRVEIILTEQNASNAILKQADPGTDMNEVLHYYLNTELRQGRVLKDKKGQYYGCPLILY